MPRRLLDTYLREAAAAVARRRKIVGERIREAREAKNLRQKDLAARVHVEPQTVSNWERGVYEPDFDTLEVIARELGQPPSFFLTAPEEATPRGEGVEERLARLERNVEELLRRIPPGEASSHE